MSRSLRLALIATLGAGILHGCAIQPPAAEVTHVSRPLMPAFELEGRIAASDGNRAANGSLLWAHSPAMDEWTVMSPLGQIVAQLVSTPLGARLLTADGTVQEDEDARTMLPRLLGVSAPLDGLASWVQASPRPGARVLSVDAIGRPARVSDAGWIIEYTEYLDVTPGAAPRRIDATWGDTRIRLIIDQWTPLT
ncbi:outer membrane lipoprotein LolB [Aromatoleum sp.]|uniref:outer membrane lipoprotein LolB n=1 Tax=Aromatoleum sp. TaxID=2307007 RepID=UPI002FC86DEC